MGTLGQERGWGQSSFGKSKNNSKKNFGEIGDEEIDSSENWRCYQYLHGDGTLTITPPPSSGKKTAIQPTTVTIKAKITFYCQCEKEFYLSPGAGAHWPSAGWGKFCSGYNSKFKWQRNITFDECRKPSEEHLLGNECTNKGIIEINKTMTLVEFITLGSTRENLPKGRVCVTYEGWNLSSPFTKLLEGCGAEVMEIKDLQGGTTTQVCFNAKDMEDCLVGSIFSCGPKGNKKAVMGFITNFIDTWLSVSGPSCWLMVT